MRTKPLFVLIHNIFKGEVGTIKFLLTVPRMFFFCGSFLMFIYRVFYAFLSVHCSIVVTCWKRANF